MVGRPCGVETCADWLQLKAGLQAEAAGGAGLPIGVAVGLATVDAAMGKLMGLDSFPADDRKNLATDCTVKASTL